ncbi:MAG: capsular polysaccharide biosynthesis protein [Clostridia bacterium]|nr:capsular polysaccharide biosynthesis protein [Clostridia bacterium]
MKNENTKLKQTSVDEAEIDLVDLFGFYMSRLPLLIIAVIVGALLAGLYTHFLVPNRYTATSKMYMVSSSSDSVVNLSDLNLGTSISNDYVELMKSRPVIEDVIDKLELKYSYDSLVKMINLSVISNTRIVKVAVTSTSPQEAMSIANQLARTSKVQLPKVMDAPAPTIVEDAVLPTVKSSPSLTKNVLIGALLCVIAVLAVLTVIYLQDDTLKSSEDVEKEFGILPLSVIPEGIIEGLNDTEEQTRRHARRRERSKA